MSNLPTKLNKSQQRDIAKILVNGASLGSDYMARGLSALYRSAMKTSQQNELAKIISYSATLGDDYMARGLSAMYRSARKTSQQDAILGVAMAFKVVSNPEFIVGNRCAYI